MAAVAVGGPAADAPGAADVDGSACADDDVADGGAGDCGGGAGVGAVNGPAVRAAASLARGVESAGGSCAWKAVQAALMALR